jgi:hypothetical protein
MVLYSRVVVVVVRAARTDTGTHGPTFVRGVRRIRPIPDSEKWVKVGACQDRVVVVEWSRDDTPLELVPAGDAKKTTRGL